MPSTFFFLDRHKPPSLGIIPLVEEADNLAGDVLPTGLLVVHDTGGGGEDDITELTGGEKLDNPLLELGETDVEAGRDDPALVEAVSHVLVCSPSRTRDGMYRASRTYRPLSWTTILPDRWSSTSSNSPM